MQTCTAEGVFGPCGCPGDSDGGAGGAGDGGDGGGGAGDNGGDGGGADGGDGDDGAGAGGDGDPPQVVTIGPEGGEVSRAGLTLVFPPGAVEQSTEIRISVGEEAPAGYELYSQLWSVEPSDLPLAAPVEVRATFSGSAALAAGFWADDSGGFERRGGTLLDELLTFSTTRLGGGFVGNGVDYEATPRHREAGCDARSRMLRGGVLAPAGVSALFAIEDCAGAPIRGLGVADLTPLEDGGTLSVETSGFQVLPHDAAIRLFVTLTLDFSSSTEAFVDEVLAGAAAFVDRVDAAGLPIAIGIVPFAGDELVDWHEPPTRDYDRLRERIASLREEFEPIDAQATNLSGALRQAHEKTAAEARRFEVHNAGGGIAVPMLVAFTDGRDTAGLGGAAPAGSTYAVALRSADYRRDELLAHLGGGEFEAQLLEPADPLELRRDFARVAAALAARVDGAFYHLAYCSASRSGAHSFSVEVVEAGATRSEAYSFEADDFEPGCSAATFTDLCAERECGGVGCGACDERVGVCNGVECVSWCATVGVCEDMTFTNPAGYRQACDAEACATDRTLPGFGVSRSGQPSWIAWVRPQDRSLLGIGENMAMAATQDGHVYLLDGEGRMAFFDLTGRRLWASEAPAEAPDLSGMTTDDGGALQISGMRILPSGEVVPRPAGTSGPWMPLPDGGFAAVDGEELVRFSAAGEELSRVHGGDNPAGFGRQAPVRRAPPLVGRPPRAPSASPARRRTHPGGLGLRRRPRRRLTRRRGGLRRRRARRPRAGRLHDRGVGHPRRRRRHPRRQGVRRQPAGAGLVSREAVLPDPHRRSGGGPGGGRRGPTHARRLHGRRRRADPVAGPPAHPRGRHRGRRRVPRVRRAAARRRRRGRPRRLHRPGRRRAGVGGLADGRGHAPLAREPDGRPAAGCRAAPLRRRRRGLPGGLGRPAGRELRARRRLAPCVGTPEGGVRAGVRAVAHRGDQ